MLFTPRATGIATNQLDRLPSIQTGVCSVRAASVEVSGDDREDGATVAGSGRRDEHIRYNLSK